MNLNTGSFNDKSPQILSSFVTDIQKGNADHEDAKNANKTKAKEHLGDKKYDEIRGYNNKDHDKIRGKVDRNHHNAFLHDNHHWSEEQRSYEMGSDQNKRSKKLKAELVKSN